MGELQEVQLATDLLTLTDTAKDFLQKAGYLFIKLRSANFDPSKNQWFLQFDVGLSQPDLKKLTLDDSGKVLSLE